MAVTDVTYDRVMIAPVDFNIFQYTHVSGAETTITYDIGMEGDPISHAQAYVNSNIWAKMLSLGYDHLDLRDTYGVIIGSLDIQCNDYDTYYCTHGIDEIGGTLYSHTLYDLTSYNNYEQNYPDGGAKYKTVIPKYFFNGDPNGLMYLCITINNVTRRYAVGSPILLQVDDWFINEPEYIGYNDIVSFTTGEGPWPSIAIETRTYQGATHKYLTYCRISPNFEGDSSVTLIEEHDPDYICDNLLLDDYIIPEEGFMNEIDNRYSPRGASNIIGMYVFDEDTMHQVAHGLIKFGFYEWVSQFFGGDFKDCVMYLNFFHGLHDQIASHIDGNSDIKAADKFLRWDDGPTDTINSDSVDTEFVEWKTPIGLRITPHFNDYRDYLCAYQLFLPYYGFINLNPNDAVNAVIKIYYNINICTRAAMITVTTNSTRTGGLETKIFTVATSVGEEIPYGKNAIQSMWLGMAQVVGKAVATGASLGTSMGSAHFTSGANLRGLQSGLSEAQDMASRAREAVGNNKFAAEMYEGQAAKIQDEINAKQKSNVITATSLNNAHSIVSGIPTPSVDHSTSSNGGNSETGTMDELHPYVLITRPVSAEPADYESYVGTPSTESVTLSSCTGFTQVAAVKPESMTDAPKYINEIISLLQAGVYL